MQRHADLQPLLVVVRVRHPLQHFAKLLFGQVFQRALVFEQRVVVLVVGIVRAGFRGAVLLQRPAATLGFETEHREQLVDVVRRDFRQEVGLDRERRHLLARSPAVRLLRIGMDADADELLAVSEHFDCLLVAFSVEEGDLALLERHRRAIHEQRLGRAPDARHRLADDCLRVVRHERRHFVVGDVDVDSRRVLRVEADVAVLVAVVRPLANLFFVGANLLPRRLSRTFAPGWDGKD